MEPFIGTAGIHNELQITNALHQVGGGKGAWNETSIAAVHLCSIAETERIARRHSSLHMFWTNRPTTLRSRKTSNRAYFKIMIWPSLRIGVLWQLSDQQEYEQLLRRNLPGGLTMFRIVLEKATNRVLLEVEGEVAPIGAASTNLEGNFTFGRWIHDMWSADVLIFIKASGMMEINESLQMMNLIKSLDCTIKECKNDEIFVTDGGCCRQTTMCQQPHNKTLGVT